MRERERERERERYYSLGSRPKELETFFSPLWLCLHNSVPSVEVLGSRGLNLNPICTMCHRSNESIEHLLKECEIAQKF